MDKLIGPIKNMNMKKTFNGGLILLALGTASLGLAKEEELVPLTEAGQKIEAHYTKQLDDLLVKFVVPLDATPRAALLNSDSRAKSTSPLSNVCSRTMNL